MNTYIDTDGYEKLTREDRINGNIRFHILIIEKIAGRALHKKECVHHINGNKSDNSLENLTLCPDQAHHNLIHRRKRAKKDCGNENWRLCHHCKEYDEPNNLYIKGTGCWHTACKKKYDSDRYYRKKNE